MNSVYETATFTQIYNAAEKAEQDWIEKMKDQLEKELKIGKPLRFYWFREKKYKEKRLFFLVNPKS
jgi:hypothetical protein